MKHHLGFIVESGTDVRLVEGLGERFDLSVIARKIVGGVEINHRPSSDINTVVGPASRIRFAISIAGYIVRNRSKFDCWVVQGYALAALAANIACRLCSKPVLMLVCSPVEAYYRCRLDQPHLGKKFRRLALWGLTLLARLNARLGSGYVVLSEHLGDVVRQHGTRRPISNIPLYGVDTDRFRPPEIPKTDAKTRLNVPTTGTLIFFSSRVAPEKDSETLLSAIQTVCAEGHEIWVLHRSGGYKEFVTAAQRLGIDKRVIATDAVHPLTELPGDYQASDICVQASRAEGLGFSPLEALSTEVPVVAAAVGGLRETIVDGETGWTYPPGNAEALATCLREVLADPEEAKRRAAAGRRMVASRFERGLVFRRFEQLVTGLLETQRESQ